MARVFCLLAVLFIIQLSPLSGTAQISGPLTATVGDPVTFTADNIAYTYTWVVDDTIQFSNPFTPVRKDNAVAVYTANGSGTLICDSGQYYLFSVQTTTGQVYRLDFGTNPDGPAAPQVVLNTSFGGGNTKQGFDIVKDHATGNWHGFVADQAQLWRLDFGPSLKNATPVVSAAMTFPGTLPDVRPVIVIHDGSEWFLFVGINGNNRKVNAFRFGAGNPLTVTPTIMNTFDTHPAETSPIRPAFYREGNDWYMLQFTWANTGELIRYRFGNSLSNIPVRNSLGTFGGNMIGYPAAPVLVNDCGRVVAYVFNQRANFNPLVKFDFGNSIANTPVPTVILPLGQAVIPLAATQYVYPYVHNDTLSVLLNYWNQGSVVPRVRLLPFPAETTNTMEQKSFTHTFTAPGTYTVYLHDNVGRLNGTSSYCHTITINPGTVAQPGTFVSPVTALCTGAGAINYEVPAQTGIDSFLWEYTGSGVSVNGTQTFPLALPAATGNIVTVNYGASATPGTLRVRAKSGTDTSVARTLPVTVNAVPDISLGVSPSICAGTTNASLPYTSVTGTPSQYSITWSNTGLVDVTNAALPASPVNISVPGSIIPDTYTGTFTVRSAAPGCVSSEKNISVTVHPVPDAVINPSGQQSVCDGDSIRLQVPLGANLVYQWDRGVITGVGAAHEYYASVAGNYTVTVTNTVTNCSAVAPSVVPVGIDTLPFVALTPAGTALLCEDDSLVLKTGTGAGYAYDWQKDNTPIGMSSSDSLVVRSGGDYHVIITDGNNCSSSSSSVSVLVLPKPLVTVTPADTSICHGTIITLHAVTADTGIDYRWQESGVVIPFATASFMDVTEAGSYTVVVTRRHVPHNCAYPSTPVDVHVYPLPGAITITWDGLELHAPPGFAAYQWFIGGQSVAGATNISFEPSEKGIFTVDATDSNGCVHTSGPLNVTNVTIPSAGEAESVAVWPNPVSGLLHIRSEAWIRVALTGLDGRMVLAADDIRSVDMSSYANGVYLLRIANKEGAHLYYEKIIKQ